MKKSMSVALTAVILSAAGVMEAQVVRVRPVVVPRPVVREQPEQRRCEPEPRESAEQQCPTMPPGRML
jgi:hypothetical protein